MPQLLIEQTNYSSFEIVEDKTGRGRFIARGEFAKANAPTQNKRRYSGKLWEREFSRLGSAMSRRRMFGELDHPEDGKTKLTRTSHIVLQLNVEEDGRVMGEAEILDTPNGRILKTLIKAGCDVGVSSRGRGSTVRAEDGYEDVQEDFNLKAFDFVADPADKDAFPEVTIESLSEGDEFEAQYAGLVEMINEEKSSQLADSKFESLVKGLRATVEEELRETFGKGLKESLVGLRESVRAEVMEELSSDPEMGAAKAVLAQVVEMMSPYRLDTDVEALRDSLKAKEIEISSLKSESAEAVSLAQKASYQLHIERKVRLHPMAATIMALMSRSDNYESVDQVDETLSEILSDLESLKIESDTDSAVSVSDEEVAALKEQVEGLVSERDSLRGEVVELKSNLGRAVEIGVSLDAQLKESLAQVKDAELEAYKSAKVNAVPNRKKALKLLESADSEDEVDSLVSEHMDAEVSDPFLQKMRLSLSRGNVNQGQVRPSNPGQLNEEVLGGIDLAEVRRLSGF